MWNNRRLTATEMQLYKQGRCICCGAETDNRFECSACYKARTRVHQDDWAHHKQGNAQFWQLKRQVL